MLSTVDDLPGSQAPLTSKQWRNDTKADHQMGSGSKEEIIAHLISFQFHWDDYWRKRMEELCTMDDGRMLQVGARSAVGCLVVMIIRVRRMVGEEK